MNERKEIQEAIAAADAALSYLREAQQHLSSARSFGIWDMLGGGTLSALIKHSKMAKAETALQQSRMALRAFAREMQDVDSLMPNTLTIDGFLTFADFFFDGLLADWLTQRKIKEAQQQVDTAIYQVSALRDRLRAL